MSEWTDQLAGARMQVDQQFRERVLESGFSNQEWGLVMTAVEWEVRDADDPEAAELVADTGNLPDIVPELDRISEQMGAAGPGVGPGGGSRESSGLLSRLGDFLDSLTGDGASGNEARLREAEELVEAYAGELQAYLEKRGQWDEIRDAAASDG